MKRNLKFRIYPTGKQEKILLSSFEMCRMTYNGLLKERIERYKNKEKLNKYSQNDLLVSTKKKFPDLKQVHSQVLQNISERIDLAFQSFFKRVKTKTGKAGFPRFKSYGRYDSITYPQSGYSLVTEGDKTKLKISKIGYVKIKLHREIHGNIKRLTIQKSCSGKWFAIFSVSSEKNSKEEKIKEEKRISNLEKQKVFDKENDVNKNKLIVGIDLGLETFATLSNGETIERVRTTKKHQNGLVKAQRRISKRKECQNDYKNSKRHKTDRKILNYKHEKIKNIRNDLSHKNSRILVNSYDVICLEDLKIKSMQRKMKDETNKQKQGRNRSIADVAWNAFVNQLQYKAEEAGTEVILVNPKNTSKTCSSCGYLVNKALSDRIHNCPMCGLLMNRDLNASINILRLGLESLGLNRKNSKFFDSIPIEAPNL